MKSFAFALTCAVVLVKLAGTPVFAQKPIFAQKTDRPPNKAGFHIGGRPFLEVATAASGSWAQWFPFNPQTFGTSSGQSPASARSRLVLIYTRALDAKFLDLAGSIDALVEPHQELEGSGIYLFDKKGAQRGGYTADELTQRIQQIQEIAQAAKLKGLSIAIAANNSPATAAGVGINDEHDVTIVYVTPGPQPATRGSIAWLRQVNTTDLTVASRAQMIAALQAQIAVGSPE
jgi:hypothetical protein